MAAAEAATKAPGTTLGQDIKEFLENEKDVEFEEEISRNPYRLKSWWRYLLAKEGARRKTRNIIHERAIKFLPNRWGFHIVNRILLVAYVTAIGGKGGGGGGA